MTGRFLAAFGLILLYMLVVAAIMLPVLLLAPAGGPLAFIGILGLFLLVFAGFFPYFGWVAKQVFRFPGQGSPVSEAELRARICEINHFDVPVMVEERGRKLVITWKYVDARWWELLAKAGLTKIYELHVKFHASRHRVTLIDITKAVSWGVGPTVVHVAWTGFRGISAGYEIGVQYGIRENLSPGKIYEYKFSPQEIKTPVMNSILRSGWDVSLGMW